MNQNLYVFYVAGLTGQYFKNTDTPLEPREAAAFAVGAAQQAKRYTSVDGTVGGVGVDPMSFKDLVAKVDALLT